MNKDFLILGVGRSGSGYIAKLFTHLGYPVGHETMASHGISSWLFAVVCDDPPTWLNGAQPEIRSKEDTFNHIIHVVRNPIHVIRSFVSWPSWEIFENWGVAKNHPPTSPGRWRQQFVLVEEKSNLVTQAVQLYIGWRKLIEINKPHLEIKLENAHETIPPYLKKHDFKIFRKGNAPATDTNTKTTLLGPNQDIDLEYIKSHISETLFYEFNKELETYKNLD